MKKVFAILLALGVLGVFAAGCSGGGDAAATPPAEGNKTPDAPKEDH